MNTPPLDPVFRAGLHHALTAQARAPRRRRRTRLFLVGGAGAVLLVAGATAATAELWALPGSTTSTALGSSISFEGTGDETLVLPAVPADADRVRVELRCLTPGEFGFPDGGSLLCSADDLRAEPEGVVSWIDLPLDVVGSRIRVPAGSGQRWRLTATFLDTATVPVEVNDRGETYGIDGAPEGRPDLIAVVATNGRSGYVYAAELDEADGSSMRFSSPDEALRRQQESVGRAVVVPVYLSDGRTRVGDFVVQ